MKKGFISTLLAYLLIICSIPINVFAESGTNVGEYSYKENFYALTAMQYKDKTIISGEGDSFVVDKLGKKTYLKNYYRYLSGNKALTTDSTPLQLAFYQSQDDEVENIHMIFQLEKRQRFMEIQMDIIK